MTHEHREPGSPGRRPLNRRCSAPAAAAAAATAVWRGVLALELLVERQRELLHHHHTKGAVGGGYACGPVEFASNQKDSKKKSTAISWRFESYKRLSGQKNR